jgi:hypothetical protein
MFVSLLAVKRRLQRVAGGYADRYISPPKMLFLVAVVCTADYKNGKSFVLRLTERVSHVATGRVVYIYMKYEIFVGAHFLQERKPGRVLTAVTVAKLSAHGHICPKNRNSE